MLNLETVKPDGRIYPRIPLTRPSFPKTRLILHSSSPPPPSSPSQWGERRRMKIPHMWMRRGGSAPTGSHPLLRPPPLPTQFKHRKHTLGNKIFTSFLHLLPVFQQTNLIWEERERDQWWVRWRLSEGHRSLNWHAHALQCMTFLHVWTMMWIIVN